jgi:O-antigen/teichoic acid export membrane protein
MLLRQTLLYLPAQTLVPLAQMAAAVLWTFWLEPQPMGTYALIWSVQELIYLSVLSWWSIYCLRYASGLLEQGKQAEFDALELWIQGAAAILQTAAAILAVALMFPGGLSVEAVLATVAFTLTRNISTHYATRARAQLEALPYTLNLLTGSLGGLLAGLYVVTQVSATPEALLAAYALAQFAGLAVSLPFMRTAARKPALSREILPSAWNFGWPLMASGILSWVSNHGIRFVVEIGLGRAAVGLMTVGWWMGQRAAAFVGLLLMGAAFNVAVERMRTGGREPALEQLATNGALLLGVVAPAVLGVVLLNVQIVALLVAEAYRVSTQEILPIAMLAGAARMAREHGTDPVFLIFERPSYPLLLSCAEGAGTMALCAIGLALGGVTGAAWGCCAGALAALAASATFARWHFGYYVLPRDLLKIAAASAVMACALALAPDTLGWIGLAVAVSGGAAVYGGVLAVLYPRASWRYGNRVLGWLKVS